MKWKQTGHRLLAIRIHLIAFIIVGVPLMLILMGLRKEVLAALLLGGLASTVVAHAAFQWVRFLAWCGAAQDRLVHAIEAKSHAVRNLPAQRIYMGTDDDGREEYLKVPPPLESRPILEDPAVALMCERLQALTPTLSAAAIYVSPDDLLAAYVRRRQREVELSQAAPGDKLQQLREKRSQLRRAATNEYDALHTREIEAIDLRIAGLESALEALMKARDERAAFEHHVESAYTAQLTAALSGTGLPLAKLEDVRHWLRAVAELERVEAQVSTGIPPGSIPDMASTLK